MKLKLWFGMFLLLTAFSLADITIDLGTTYGIQGSTVKIPVTINDNEISSGNVMDFFILEISHGAEVTYTSVTNLQSELKSGIITDSNGYTRIELFTFESAGIQNGNLLSLNFIINDLTSPISINAIPYDLAMNVGSYWELDGITQPGVAGINGYIYSCLDDDYECGYYCGPCEDIETCESNSCVLDPKKDFMNKMETVYDTNQEKFEQRSWGTTIITAIAQALKEFFNIS
jgi:hypothetical protein